MKLVLPLRSTCLVTPRITFVCQSPNKERRVSEQAEKTQYQNWLTPIILQGILQPFILTSQTDSAKKASSGWQTLNTTDEMLD